MTSTFSNTVMTGPTEEVFLPVHPIIDQLPSTDNYIGRFRQSFEAITRQKSLPVKASDNPTGLTEALVNISPTTVGPVASTRVAAINKLIRDWQSESEFGYILTRFHDLRKTSYREKIVRRIQALYQMAQEEDGEPELSIASLKSFFEFFVRHPTLSYPEITLTPEGDIYARWKGNNRSLCSIHFLPEFMVRYVIFVANRRRLDLLDRVSGTSTVDTVLETADRAFGVNQWVLE